MFISSIRIGGVAPTNGLLSAIVDLILLQHASMICDRTPGVRDTLGEAGVPMAVVCILRRSYRGTWIQNIQSQSIRIFVSHGLPTQRYTDELSAFILHKSFQLPRPHNRRLSLPPIAEVPTASCILMILAHLPTVLAALALLGYNQHRVSSSGKLF